MSDRRASRRALLGLLPALAAAGCAVTDPRIGSRPRPTTTPGGSPGTGAPPVATPGTSANPGSSTAPGAGGAEAVLVAASTAELRAARQIGLLLDASDLELTARQRTLLSGLRDVHRGHAAVLSGPDPAARIPGSTPAEDTVAIAGLTATLSALRRAEQALATRHAAAAAHARGLSALLFASLAAGARSYAVAVADRTPPAVSRTAGTGTVTVVSDVVAQQALVAQTYALIYGYQVALGRLSTGGAAHTRAAAALVARRTLRDRLIAQLIEVDADVPAAEAAYRLPEPVQDAAAAGRLIRGMETAFLPWVGQWVAAAARSADRRVALQTLAEVSGAATSWGAAPRSWPGWP